MKIKTKVRGGRVPLEQFPDDPSPVPPGRGCG